MLISSEELAAPLYTTVDPAAFEGSLTVSVPSSFSVPALVNVDVTVRSLPARSSTAPEFMASVPAVLAASRTGSVPASAITTLSYCDGTTPISQLAAAPQSDEAEPSHVA